MTEFITKDSGERAEFESGMRRDTEAGKPRFDLMLPEGVPYEEQMLTRYAALLGRGAEKYDERNWEKANSKAELDRMKSSAFRHFIQWLTGERDEDHAAAVIFNIVAAETTALKVQPEPEEAEEETMVVSGTIQAQSISTNQIDGIGPDLLSKRKPIVNGIPTLIEDERPNHGVQRSFDAPPYLMR